MSNSPLTFDAGHKFEKTVCVVCGLKLQDYMKEKLATERIILCTDRNKKLLKTGKGKHK